MKYRLIEFLRHMEQAKDDACDWIGNRRSAHSGFQTERERSAYMAGHVQGARDALSMLKLHAGIKLPEA